MSGPDSTQLIQIHHGCTNYFAGTTVATNAHLSSRLTRLKPTESNMKMNPFCACPESVISSKAQKSTTSPVIEHLSHRKSQYAQRWMEKGESDGGFCFAVFPPWDQFVTNLLMMKQANMLSELPKVKSPDMLFSTVFPSLWKLWNRQRSSLDAPFTDLCCHQSRLLTLQ